MYIEEKIIKEYIVENSPRDILDISQIIGLEFGGFDSNGNILLEYEIDNKRPYGIDCYDWFMPYDLYIRKLRKEKIRCLLQKKS